MKLMCIGDVHIGAIDRDNFLDNELPWVLNQIEIVRPNMVCLLGDETDSSELKVKSENYETLTKFIKDIYKKCTDLDIYLRIIHGTQSHCGKNIESVVTAIDNKTRSKEGKFILRYNKKTTYEMFGKYKILYLPEQMYTTYEEFLEDIDVMGNSDIILTHNLVDKALPVVKQVDSQYGLGKSVVINYSDLCCRTQLIVASHVHTDFSFEKLHYTNTLTSIVHTSESTSIPGYIISDLSSMEVSRVVNPYAHRYKTVTISESDISNNTVEDLVKFTSSELLSVQRKYNIKSDNIRINIKCNSDINDMTKCSILKKTFHANKFKIVIINKESIELERDIFSDMCVEDIIISHMEKIHKIIDKKRLHEICGIK